MTADGISSATCRSLCKIFYKMVNEETCYQVEAAIIIIKALVLTATNLKNNALLMNKAYFSLMERNQWLVLPA